MSLLTKEQAQDTRERIVNVARSMMETDAGRAELVKLAGEIDTLAALAQARAQFAAAELNGQRLEQKPIDEQRGDVSAQKVYIP